MADPIGRILSAAREDRKLSVQGLSKITRIPSAAIAALEEGRFEALPAPVFVRGFIRAYCREVDLDPVEVLARYDAHLSQAAIESPDGGGVNLGPIFLNKDDVPRESHRGLQISHVLLLLLALVTFIIAYLSAGTPTASSTAASNGGGDTAQTERAAGQPTTYNR